MSIRKWVSSLVGSGQKPQGEGDSSADGDSGTSAPSPLPTKGPNLLQLEAVAAQARSIKLTLQLNRASGPPLEVTVRQAGPGWVRTTTSGEGIRPTHRTTRSFVDALTALAQRVGSDGLLEPTSFKAASAASPVRGPKLAALCAAALYEAMGKTPPSEEELAARREATRSEERGKQSQVKAKRRELLSLLAGGPEGVKAWNHRRTEALDVAPFKKADLVGKDISGADLVDMPEGRFAGTSLARCDLREKDLSKADFQMANLREARADKANLRKATFAGANLDGAVLSFSYLQGVNFAGATVVGTQWREAHFDETTVWPDGFALPEDLRWTGKGPSPAALAAIAARRKSEGPIDAKAFMQRLHKTIEKARLSKALSMLKTDRFKLFVEVSDAALAGIVKSQNDPDLVYSCTLTASGAFSCCTQNLNVCGGLRGALCKHLLVLVVGLAQAGEISPDTLDDWVQRSTLHQPELQREAASAILLRYKGAEAGEIDWRPTETVPEDFYAY
jgi:Pentapeptide repeats (8 copies)